MATRYQVVTAGIKVGRRQEDLTMAVGQALDLLKRGYDTWIQARNEFAVDVCRLISDGDTATVDRQRAPGALAENVDRILINLQQEGVA